MQISKCWGFLMHTGHSNWEQEGPRGRHNACTLNSGSPRRTKNVVVFERQREADKPEANGIASSTKGADTTMGADWSRLRWATTGSEKSIWSVRPSNGRYRPLDKHDAPDTD